MDEQDTQAAAELITGPIYKYRSLSGPPEGKDEDPVNPSPRECTRRLIVEGEVYHAHRDELNDPFEMRFGYDFDGTNDQKCERIIAARMKQGYSYAVAASQAIEIFNKPEGIDGYLEKRATQASDVIPSKYGIFSASLCSNDILMWSHYAQQHKGICVRLRELARPEDAEWWGHCFRVDYPHDNAFPIHKLFTGTQESLFRKAALTKARHWGYEKEVRHFGAPGTSSLPEGMITGIIFGVNTSEEDKELVRGWVEKAGLDVEFMQAELKERHYGLDIVDC